MAVSRSTIELIRATLRNARITADDGGLPVYLQLLEMTKMYAHRRIGPGFYQTAGLGRTGISFAEKCNYLSQEEFDKRLDIINPVNYRKISQNKISEKALLSAFAVPTPILLGYLNSDRGSAVDGSSLKTSDDLEAFLGRYLDRKICFKETEGWEGKNFTPVEVSRIHDRTMIRPLLEEKWLEVAEFHAERLSCGGGDWLIEDYLTQHPWFAAFNHSSVNSVRVWVFQNGSSQNQILGAFLRTGREGCTVDNDTSSGRIVIPIDIESGILDCGLDGLPSRSSYHFHPDSGRQIQGEQMPLWQEIQDLAISALEKFPRMRFAGVDIAVGLEQPVVLELNLVPDYSGSAILNLPLRDVLCP